MGVSWDVETLNNDQHIRVNVRTGEQLLDCVRQGGGLEHAVYCMNTYKHSF